MKIGVITTVDTNIGDDLIRQGVTVVLETYFSGCELSYVLVNKHEPSGVYPAWHPVYWSGQLPRFGHRAAAITGSALHRLGGTLFDECDLIVQSGAPVLWENCHRTEWRTVLWRQVVRRLRGRIPVVNLAGGSCYPWENQPWSIQNLADREYAEAIVGDCDLFTVRDRVAGALVKSIGCEAPVVPCTALLFGMGFDIESARPARERPLILINFMRGGGHYDWNQGISDAAWEQTAGELIDRLRSRYDVAFLCHNRREYDAAAALRPSVDRRWPRSPHEFIRMTRDATAGVCNRLHATVGMASIGIPSIAVGTDTRLLMVDEIGLPNYYVKEVTAEMLAAGVDELVIQKDAIRCRLTNLRRDTLAAYVKQMHTALADRW